MKVNAENLELKDKLLKEHHAQVKDKKKTSKNTGGPMGTPGAKDGGKKSSGGSANTSRASTPVSERSFKITASSSSKRLLGDDDRSTSSREDESLIRRAKRTRLSESMMDETADQWRFRIDIPEELKYVLVSDMDLVTVKKSLFGLPAKTSVATILSDYVKHVEKNQSENAATVNDVMAGIKDLFNATVDSQLLYRLEKNQYSEKVLKENLLPSQVYGSAHLLRLMVKIGPLLNASNLDTTAEANVSLIENIICDLLLYLESNSYRLFTSKNYTESGEIYEESGSGSTSAASEKPSGSGAQVEVSVKD